MRKHCCAFLILAALCAGCHSNSSSTTTKKQAEPAATRHTPSEREQLESEIRDSSTLKDPGGARDLRDSAAEQDKQQQEQVNEVDNQ